MTPIYTIRDWDKHYENNRSRTVDRLAWVLVPNKHDGEGYGTIMIQPDAAELFAAWVLILQVSSKCQSRGRLVTDDGRPMTPEILAVKTRGRVEWFKRAFDFFTSTVQWLETESQPVENQSQGDSEKSDCQPTVSQVSADCQAPDEEQNRTEQKGTEQNPPTPRGGDSGFAAFWKVYPKKVGKGAAQKAWSKAKSKPPLADILAAVEAQKASRQWTRDDGQFIPNPATWINQGRWDDETEIEPRDKYAEGF